MRGILLRIRPYISGIASLVPGLYERLRRPLGGTDSARYCYAVWMRHLVRCCAAGRRAPPRVVAELGPGDSLGVGVAALLTCADRYHAFDVVEHATTRTSLEVFDEILDLIARRAPVPGNDEFPEIQPELDDTRFPSELLPEASLEQALAPERVKRLRDDLGRLGASGSAFDYRVPWHDARVVDRDTVDLIFSQAVLEHVDDLDLAYSAAYQWLRPGGAMSHQIDFRSHGITEAWNGHLAIGDLRWAIIRGRRPYLLNRRVYSEHRRLIQSKGFSIELELKTQGSDGVPHGLLAQRFSGISAEDLATSGAFVVASKPGG